MAKRKVAKQKVAKKKGTAHKGRAKTSARRAAKRAAKPSKRAAPAAVSAAASATPYLCCKGASAALDFYRKAFGAQERMRVAGKDGSIGHADIAIEGASIMLSDEWPEGGVFSPQTLGGSAVTIHLYVRDVDAFTDRAVSAGASLLRPVADMPYGDRSASLRDPFGHRWNFATKKEEVSKQEMERRFGGAFLVT
ncbi:MAG: VOC family protein [Myxococcota bacterium]